MDKANLTERGWVSQEVQPGNCIRERWKKDGVGLQGEITVTNKDEVSGLIKATEELAAAKRKGELILKQLQNPEEAAEIIDRLMRALSAEVPYQMDRAVLV